MGTNRSSRLRFLVTNSLLSPLGGIKLAGSIIDSEGVKTPTRVLNRFSLVLVVDGEGYYKDQSGASMNLVPGDVILIHPDISHWYGPKKGKHWDEIFIIFEGPIFDLWCQEPFLNFAKKHIHLEPLAHWKERFVWACGRQHGDDPHEQAKDVIRMQQLISEIYKATSLSDPPLDWIDLAKSLLEREGDPHKAAEAMNVNYDTFRKKFKKLSGIPPQQYLIYASIKSAKKMLNDTSDPIYKISLKLGYCNEFHFSKQFNKVVGCSPTEYRAMSQNNPYV